MKAIKGVGGKDITEYPSIGIYPPCGLVVLFVSDRTGLIVGSNSDAYVQGAFLSNFVMANFELFNGTIELSND